MSPNKAEKEEARILKTRGKFRAELLTWVTSPEHEITQDVDRFLDHVMKDRRRRIEVFLTALARKYVERAVFFVGRLPEIEEELLDPKRIRTMKNSDLIRLLALLASQVDDASEFLRNFVSDDDLRSEPLPTPGSEFPAGEKEVVVDDVSDDERKAAAELPVESRQRVSHVIMNVLKAIDAVDGDKQVPELPAPDKLDGASTKKKAKKATKKRRKKVKGG